MTPEQRSGYIDLLSQAWIADPPCSLPDDDAKLAGLSGLGERWGSASEIIRAQFVVKRGRLWNLKQVETFRKACEFRRKKQDAGIKGNDKRWNKQDNESSHSDRGGIANTSPSLSLSYSYSEEEKNNHHAASAGNGNGHGKAHVELDPELRQTLEKTSHLRLLLDPAAAAWWQKLLSIYEPIAELYVFDELAKADLWIEQHKDRTPRTLRGAEQFISNWFKNAEEKARKLAAGIAAARRTYATQAPARR